MKRLGLLLVLALGATAASAQDILTFKDCHVKNVKVLKISPQEVTYRDSNDPNGPEYREKRDNLFSVQLENGKFIKMNDSKSMNYTYSDGKLLEENPERKYFGQIDFYVQNGWGVGFMVRRKLNDYAEWNLIGGSYMSGWVDPRNFGFVNVRVMGLRLKTPDLGGFKLFSEVTPGYTFLYKDHPTGYMSSRNDEYHLFGLDFCTGFQIGNKIAIGYNLNYLNNTYMSEMSHWGRISVLF